MSYRMPPFLEIVNLTRTKYAGNDDIITRKIWRPCSAIVVYLALRGGVSANQVTVSFILAGLLASVILATDIEYKHEVAGLLLILLFILDLADGYVARFTKTQSKFGTVLDGIGHLAVNSSIALVLSDDLLYFVLLSLSLNAGLGFYALYLSGNNYEERLGASFLQTSSEPSKLIRHVAKALVFPIENPGIGYCLILMGLLHLDTWIVPIFVLSGVSVGLFAILFTITNNPMVESL